MVVREHLGPSTFAALKLQPHECVALELILDIEISAVMWQCSPENLAVDRIYCCLARHGV